MGVTGNPQPTSVIERMLTADDVAQATLWMLTQPDHVQINDVEINNAVNPWQQ